MPPDPDRLRSAIAKRLFDILFSLLVLAVTSPVLAVAAIAVKLYGPGPVIYRGIRVGRGGAPFRLYKFRTMVPDAESIGPAVTAAGDGRVTSVGRWLRRLKFDELPQFVNVLAGDMSVVGPRPEHPDFVALYTDRQRRVLTVKPGITSVAALEFGDEESLLSADARSVYVKQIMPAKLDLDLNYLDSQTFRGDLVLILRTARLVVSRVV